MPELAATHPFMLALTHAREAVDEALDALNTLDSVDSELALALIRAQGQIEKAQEEVDDA